MLGQPPDPTEAPSWQGDHRDLPGRRDHPRPATWNASPHLTTWPPPSPAFDRHIEQAGDPTGATLATRLHPWVRHLRRSRQRPHHLPGSGTGHGADSELGRSRAARLTVWSLRHLPDEIRAVGTCSPWTPSGATSTPPTHHHRGDDDRPAPHRPTGRAARATRPARGSGPVRRLVVVDEAWMLLRDGEGARFLFRMAKAPGKERLAVQVYSHATCGIRSQARQGGRVSTRSGSATVPPPTRLTCGGRGDRHPAGLTGPTGACRHPPAGPGPARTSTAATRTTATPTSRRGDQVPGSCARVIGVVRHDCSLVCLVAGALVSWERTPGGVCDPVLVPEQTAYSRGEATARNGNTGRPASRGLRPAGVEPSRASPA